MPTINAGQSLTLTVSQNTRLDFVGSGVVTIGPGPLNGQPTNITNAGVVGPFLGRDQVVYITAGASGLSYDVNRTDLVPAVGAVGSGTTPQAQALTGTPSEISVGRSLVSTGGIISDLIVDYIASGLALPTTGGLSNSVTSGVVYLQGAKVSIAGQAVTLSASSDNYIDAKPDGTLQVSAVANGAASPAVAVNGIRLGYVVTGASTVSSAVTTNKDSLGNWMGNRSKYASCILGGLTNQSAGAGADTSVNFGSPSTMTAYSGLGLTTGSAEILDNLGLHSSATNSHRITVTQTGYYNVFGQVALGASAGLTTLAVRKNANVTAGIPTASVTPSAAQTLSVSGLIYLVAGDFIYLRVNSAAGTALTEVQLNLVRVS